MSSPENFPQGNNMGTEGKRDDESLLEYIQRIRNLDPESKARREADALALERQLEAQKTEQKPRTALPSRGPASKDRSFSPQDLAAGENIEHPPVKPVLDLDGKPTGEFVIVEDNKE